MRQTRTTTFTEDSSTRCTQTNATMTYRNNTGQVYWQLIGFMDIPTSIWNCFCTDLILAYIDTHSDPDESPSTVPALMLITTPFSWSGRLGLGGPARLSLPDDSCGDTVPGGFSHSSLWIRLKPFLSTIGESCFFFRIPAQHENKMWFSHIHS